MFVSDEPFEICNFHRRDYKNLYHDFMIDDYCVPYVLCGYISLFLFVSHIFLMGYTSFFGCVFTVFVDEISNS